MRNALIFIVFIFAGFSANAQSEPKEKFAVFVVDGLTGPEQCRFVDGEMRKIDKVIVSRMDIPTSRYLIQFYDDAPFDETWFSTKFLSWGLTIHCYIEGYEGLREACSLTKSNCSEINN